MREVLDIAFPFDDILNSIPIRQDLATMVCCHDNAVSSVLVHCLRVLTLYSPSDTLFIKAPFC